MDVEKTLPSITVGFTVRGVFDPDSFTNALEIEPSTVRHKGSVLGQLEKTLAFDVWTLQSPQKASWDVDSVVEEVLELLTPHEEFLIVERQHHDLTFAFEVTVVCTNGSIPSVELSASLLGQIARLGAGFSMEWWLE